MSRPVGLVHGTMTAYTKRKCRCEQCCQANRKYQKQWELDRALNRNPRHVPTAPIKKYVEELLALGMTKTDIALAAGWSWPNSLHAAMSRPTIRVATAERIMSISKEAYTATAKEFPGWMVTRRVRALYAIGWSTEILAQRTGIPQEQLRIFMRGKRRTSYRSTAEKIFAIYDELQEIPGPSRYALNRAKARGYAPPMAWVDIDNPRERPLVPRKRR